MEKLLRALERRFGRYAIQNVAILLVAPKVAFFLFAMSRGDAANGVLSKVALVPKLLLEGQAWRAVSFIITPPTSSPLWFLIYVMLTFLYCSALLQQWGALRLNVYLLTGWLFTVLGSLGAYALDPSYVHFQGFAHVELTLLFGFATFFPNYEFRLFFILPVKVKWVALLIGAAAVYQVMDGSWSAAADYAPRLMLLCAFANYLLFFGPSLVKSTVQKQKASNRRREFEEAMRRGHEERERAQREDDEERERALRELDEREK